MKQLLRNNLSIKNRRILKNLYDDFRAIGSTYNLDRLGTIYGTDKNGIHSYTQHYNTHFRSLKYKRMNIFEIGLGGYKHPHYGGNSLRMWKRYFPYSQIYALDIYDKSFLEEDRIRIFQGSQVDKEIIDQVLDEAGELDLIIDDGSHMNEHVIGSFELLFPRLKSGGIYVVEDTQTSYWTDYGGDADNLENPNTMMNYFKCLTDCMNFIEFKNDTYRLLQFKNQVASIHFYHNIIFIYKI